jgi:hypothetical protein
MAEDQVPNAAQTLALLQLRLQYRYQHEDGKLAEHGESLLLFCQEFLGNRPVLSRRGSWECIPVMLEPGTQEAHTIIHIQVKNLYLLCELSSLAIVAETNVLASQVDFIYRQRLNEDRTLVPTYAQNLWVSLKREARTHRLRNLVEGGTMIGLNIYRVGVEPGGMGFYSRGKFMRSLAPAQDLGPELASPSFQLGPFVNGMYVTRLRLLCGEANFMQATVC